MNDNKYPTPHPQVAARTVEGSAVIVLADSGIVNVLNEVGTRAWELMDGTRNVAQIAHEIADEYEVSLDQAAQDVDELVQKLLDARAITLNDQPTP